MNYRGYEIEQSEDGYFVARVSPEYRSLEEIKAEIDAWIEACA
jgi:hypothetical protein